MRIAIYAQQTVRAGDVAGLDVSKAEDLVKDRYFPPDRNDPNDGWDDGDIYVLEGTPVELKAQAEDILKHNPGHNPNEMFEQKLALSILGEVEGLA